MSTVSTKSGARVNSDKWEPEFAPTGERYLLTDDEILILLRELAAVVPRASTKKATVGRRVRTWNALLVGLRKVELRRRRRARRRARGAAPSPRRSERRLEAVLGELPPLPTGELFHFPESEWSESGGAS